MSKSIIFSGLSLLFFIFFMISLIFWSKEVSALYIILLFSTYHFLFFIYPARKISIGLSFAHLILCFLYSYLFIFGIIIHQTYATSKVVIILTLLTFFLLSISSIFIIIENIVIWIKNKVNGSKFNEDDENKLLSLDITIPLNYIKINANIALSIFLTCICNIIAIDDRFHIIIRLIAFIFIIFPIYHYFRNSSLILGQYVLILNKDNLTIIAVS